MSGARTSLGAALVLLGGCQVSVFGSDPITVVGSDVGAGTEARPCGEPDDARRAREHAEACSARCRIEAGALEGQCPLELGAPRQNVATIDLGDADGIVVRIELCDVSGAAFELGDALPGASSHDARIRLEGTTLTIQASEGSGVEDSVVRGFVPGSGCATRTLVLADQIVYLVEADAGVCGRAMLRIRPPTDRRGAPDALWYLALGGTLDGATSGRGPRSVDLCFW